MKKFIKDILIKISKKIEEKGAYHYIGKLIIIATLLIEVEILWVIISVENDFKGFISELIYYNTKVAIAYMALFFTMYFLSNYRTRNLTDEEYEEMKDDYVYHLTNEGNAKSIIGKAFIKEGEVMVDIKPTRNWVANIPVLFKHSTYTFKNKPTVEELDSQGLKTKSNCLFKIAVKDINKHKLGIRPKKNVIIIKGGYIGPAEIEVFKRADYKNNHIKSAKNLFKSINNLNDLIILASVFLLLITLLFI